MDETEDNLIDFKCPYCGEAVSFPEMDADSLQDCPFCAEVILVPPASAEFGQKLPLPIQTPRLILRRLCREDHPDLVDLMTDAELFRWLEWGPLAEEEILPWLEADEQARLTQPGKPLVLGIEISGKGTVIGWGSLKYSDEWRGDKLKRDADIGVLINRNHHRQGYGSEALRGILEFGFRGIHLRRITASCDSRNIAGCGVLEKAGMREEGEFLKDRNLKGEWADTSYYALLREEYESAQPQRPQ
ncbi:MAG TPA: GNAT family protein [Verrucomicrobiae bacterium]|nr:GNAT family protein [Verrucomicrobiae bacterium]